MCFTYDQVLAQCCIYKLTIRQHCHTVACSLRLIHSFISTTKPNRNTSQIQHVTFKALYSSISLIAQTKYQGFASAQLWLTGLWKMDIKTEGKLDAANFAKSSTLQFKIIGYSFVGYKYEFSICKQMLTNFLTQLIKSCRFYLLLDKICHFL